MLLLRRIVGSGHGRQCGWMAHLDALPGAQAQSLWDFARGGRREGDGTMDATLEAAVV